MKTKWRSFFLQEKVAVLTFPSLSLSYGDHYHNRVNFSANAQQSDASITIGQLTMDDNGTYECSVSLLQDLDGTSKGRVRLLVLGEWPPGPAGAVSREGVWGGQVAWGRRSQRRQCLARSSDCPVTCPSARPSTSGQGRCASPAA